MNSWSIAMYACRYGNLELLQYLHSKKLTQDGSYQYTLVHAACFGNELEILKYLVDTLKKSILPLNEQQHPLKICLRAENLLISEFLISRGAFFQYGLFCHNAKVEVIQTSPQGVQQYKYKTISRGPKNELVETEIPASFVASPNCISRDSPIFSFLRFIRVRNFFYVKRIADSPSFPPFSDEKKKENFIFLAKIAFENNETHNPTARILEFLVGQKEKREPNTPFLQNSLQPQVQVNQMNSQTQPLYQQQTQNVQGNQSITSFSSLGNSSIHF